MLKHLSIIEMAQLVRPWVTPTKRRAVFLSIPAISGLHPMFVQIHGELVAARPAESKASAQLRAVIAEAEEVDVRHDALARATHFGLVAERGYALASKPPALARARQVDEALAKLFPSGLAIVNASLLAESGNTARIVKLLEREPGLEELLASIPVHGFGDLAVVVRRWLATGKKLARLEETREDLEADQATTPLGREAITRLRARWIRLVSQVLALLDLSDADPTAVARIRGPILKASARAARRYGAPVEPAEALAAAQPDEDDDEAALAVANAS
jgi:hypothetical protein